MTTTQVNIEERLRNLYRLQLVDSKIDDIVRLRGALPMEVSNLEKDIAQIESKLNTRLDELSALKHKVADKENLIEESFELAKRYEKQLEEVSNNREYESLNTEIEYQQLEIEHCHKIITQCEAQIEDKKEHIEKVQDEFEKKQQHLEDKKRELNIILEETAKEEKATKKFRDKFQSVIDKKLLDQYEKIRKFAKNGLAVATVDNNVAVGSFFVLTAQLRIDISNRNRIVTDPYSGRILVDAALAKEEEEKVKELFS